MPPLPDFKVDPGDMSAETVPRSDPRLLLLAPGDNVLVARKAIEPGEPIMVAGALVDTGNRVGMGHKLAAKAIGVGDKIIKYGAPIGSATVPIRVGDHVHIHNVKSDYTPTYALPPEGPDEGAGR